MNYKKVALLVLLAVATAIIIISFVFSGEIALLIFAKAHNLEISYKSMSRGPDKWVLFEKLTVVDSRKGAGFFADTAKIMPDIKFIGSSVKFDMKLVNFIKKGTAEAKESYDSLTDLIAAPFMTQWKYEKISGDIIFGRDRITIKRLEALSREIRLDISGDILHDNTVKGSVTVYFNKSLTSKIPDELSSVILQNEDNEWKSLSVSLTGNYKTPSIQVSNKLFRLNIKSIKNSAK